jgi:outer membrane protein assembly factor BamB
MTILFARPRCIAASLIRLFAVLCCTASASAEDWPQWRGPQRDGISRESGLLAQWPAGGPAVAWTASGLGAGYSSISVADGRIFTLGDLNDGNYVIALHESNGTLAWSTKIGEAGGHPKYTGPRSTPTVDGDQVFVLNQHSDLVCLNKTTGDIVWSRNLEQDFGGKMMSGWRYSESPLVDGRQVVCTPGGNQGAMVAVDRNSGQLIWQTSEWTDPAGYSSIVVATIHGTRQYVQLTGRSVAGIEPETGEVLWMAPRMGKTAVVPTPVVDGDLVFVTSGYGVGCNAFRVKNQGDDWSAEEVYANTDIANHHGGVILLGHHVFGSTEGTFRCANIETGDLDFKARSVGKGAVVLADGHFYLRSEQGPVALLEATTKGYLEVGRFDQPGRSDQRAWPHPVVANGKLYLRDQDILLCYDVTAP